jgi:hypothetical protein
MDDAGQGFVDSAVAAKGCDEVRTLVNTLFGDGTGASWTLRRSERNTMPAGAQSRRDALDQPGAAAPQFASARIVDQTDVLIGNSSL